MYYSNHESINICIYFCTMFSPVRAKTRQAPKTSLLSLETDSMWRHRRAPHVIIFIGTLEYYKLKFYRLNYALFFSISFDIAHRGMLWSVRLDCPWSILIILHFVLYVCPWPPGNLREYRWSIRPWVYILEIYNELNLCQ